MSDDIDSMTNEALDIAVSREVMKQTEPFDCEFWNPYSTHIMAAWMVVEKLHERGFAIDVFRTEYDDSSWIFTVGKGDKINGEIAQFSDRNLPRAICIAALRAVRFTRDAEKE